MKENMEAKRRFVGQYIVISPDDDNEVKGEQVAGEVLTTGRRYDTQEEAERSIVEDISGWYATEQNGGVTRGEHFDFGQIHFVCKVVSAVRPVPVVSFKVRLDSCD